MQLRSESVVAALLALFKSGLSQQKLLIVQQDALPAEATDICLAAEVELVLGWGQRVWLTPDGIMYVEHDVHRALATLRACTDTTGIKYATVNELRRMAGLGPLPGDTGDVLLYRAEKEPWVI